MKAYRSMMNNLTCIVLVFVSTQSLSSNTLNTDSKFSEIYVKKAIHTKKPSILITAALLSKKFNTSISTNEVYKLVIKQNIDSALLLEQIIKTCLFKKKTYCKTEEMIFKLKKLTPTRSFPFIYSTLLFVEDNKLDKALLELKEALLINNFHDNYWNVFDIVRTELNNNGFSKDNIQSKSIVYSFHHVIEPYNRIINLCKKQIGRNKDWKETCLKLGETLVLQGNIFYANMVGYALQREVLSINSIDSKKLMSIKSNKEKLNQWRINAVKRLDFISFERDGPLSYYQNLIQLGEIGATKKALVDANKL